MSQTKEVDLLEDETVEMAVLCSRHAGQCQNGLLPFEFWICEIKDFALVGGKTLKSSARKKGIQANLTSE